MGSDFPSIADINQKSAVGSGSSPQGVQAKFGKKMAEIGIKQKESVVAAAAQGLQIPYIDLAKFPVSTEALKAVPPELAEQLKAVCFYFTPEDLRIGALDPNDEVKEMAYQLAERFHADVQIYLISEHSLEYVLKLYANLPNILPITKDINITDEEINRYALTINNLQSLQDAFQQVSITDILTLMVASAIKVNASDIHVEAEENEIKVRYRIDSFGAGGMIDPCPLEINTGYCAGNNISIVRLMAHLNS